MFKKSIFFFYLVFINFIQLNSQTLVFAEIQGSPIISTAGWNLTGAAAIGDTGGDADSDPNELILTQNIGTSSGGIFRQRGFPSRFNNITAGGGGAGAVVPFNSDEFIRFGQDGQDNSSSGGGSVTHTYAAGFGQTGVTIQNGIKNGVGFNGILSVVTFASSTYGGGGGGAGGVGSTFQGGNGKISTITGLFYGGGGNAVFTANTPTVRVLNTYGTNSIGGQGYYGGASNGTYIPARTNSGGGGGALFKWRNEQFISDDGVPRHGAAGVVVIRYATGTLSASGGTVSTNGIYTLHTFTANGTFTTN